ncbi:NHL repeat containing protein [Fimbriimonas ginsengisoli Gsoil 348]|uniref:NHL repeat containing protein n=1 Tax=Fimbriimonas ginsengisoli Gsoil 348 TaxID=661478 RepID=A0A068NY54_FIMGI|nr:NHL repeat containing protein [Fimbriimonas ginsengisoli Gsoil 348]
MEKGEGTARVIVNVETGEVTVRPLQPGTSRATFGGSALSVTSSRLLEIPGETTLRRLQISLKNNLAENIGGSNGLRVILSNFVNGTGSVTDLRSLTTVTKVIGTGTNSSVDGPAGGTTLSSPLSLAAISNNEFYWGELVGGLRKNDNGTTSHLATGTAKVQAVSVIGTWVYFFMANNGWELWRVHKDGTGLEKIAGGAAGYADGNGLNARFNTVRAMDTDGTRLFVADGGNNAVRVISDLDGLRTTTTLTLSGTLAGMLGITYGQVGGSNKLFATVSRRVFVIDPTTGASAPIAGNGQPVQADGTGVEARFDTPVGIAISNGGIYVCDAGTVRQLTLNPSGSITNPHDYLVSTIAGNGIAGDLDGPGDVAQFDGKAYLATDTSGDLWMTSPAFNKIKKIAAVSGNLPVSSASVGTSEPVRVSNPTGFLPWTGGDAPYFQLASTLAPQTTVPVPAWNFALPAGVRQFSFTITVEADTTIESSIGAMYDPTQAGFYGADNVLLRTIAGRYTGADVRPQDGSGTSARIRKVSSIATAADGTVFFVDQAEDGYPRMVRRMEPSGLITTIMPYNPGGSLTNGYGDEVVQGQIDSVECSPDGRRLFMFCHQDPDGISTKGGELRTAYLGPGLDPRLPGSWYVLKIAGNSTDTNLYSNGLGGDARFSTCAPDLIWSESTRTLYICEWDGNRVRKVTQRDEAPDLATSWQVDLVAGSESGASGLADGQGASALFSAPVAIAAMPDGAILVSDHENNLVRRVDPDGTVSVYAGTGEVAADPEASGTWYADGDGIAAGVYHPGSIAVDPYGYAYVWTHNRLRRISPGQKRVATVVYGVDSAPADGNCSTTAREATGAYQTLAFDRNGNLYAGSHRTMRLYQRLIQSGSK